MIEHELLFLGLLIDQPKHGYDIKRQIEEELQPNVGLKIKSIYYPLQKLEEMGFVEKQTGRQGRWPEKMVYRITSKGKKRFDDLIAQSFLSVGRPFFEIDLSIYFLPFIDKRVAKRRLRARQMLLTKIHKQMLKLKDQQPPKPTFLILNHDIHLVKAEIEATQNLISALDE